MDFGGHFPLKFWVWWLFLNAKMILGALNRAPKIVKHYAPAPSAGRVLDGDRAPRWMMSSDCDMGMGKVW
jgi:hypothetical protein